MQDRERKLRLRKDRRVPEVEDRMVEYSNGVGGSCKYLYVQLCMYRYKRPIQTKRPTTPPSKQPSALSIAEAARDITSTDSYLLEKTVPESEKRAAIYTQIRNIYRQISSSRIRAHILPRSDTSIPQTRPHNVSANIFYPSKVTCFPLLPQGHTPP
jgi:hypothetical protein